MQPSTSEGQSALDTFCSRPTLLRLSAGVQHYAWGDTRFIPALLSQANPEDKPCAELWMGAHPDLPAKAELDGASIGLDELIGHCATAMLGPAVAAEFDGRLPYLFKVLAAAQPLSIQAHPTKAVAEEGFARENDAGIPITAKHRNYKDDNHKPELIAALTDFYALRGFRPRSEIAQVLREVPELSHLQANFEPSPAGLKAIYEHFMLLPQADVDGVLGPLIQRLEAEEKQRPFARSDREYWVLRAHQQFSLEGHQDRGLFSIFLLNLVHLRPGEAMYLSAGILHAYLEGAGMEIMANSNNVLRGGLTPKHVDVPELLANVTFSGGEPEIVRAVRIPDSQEWAYKTPAREFELRRIEVADGQPYRSGTQHSADILLAIHDGGEPLTVRGADEQFQLNKGSVVLAPTGVEYSISTSGQAVLYRATIP